MADEAWLQHKFGLTVMQLHLPRLYGKVAE